MLKILSLLAVMATLFGSTHLFGEHPPVRKALVIEVNFDHPPVTTK